MPDSHIALADQITAHAHALGFDLVAVTAAAPSLAMEQYQAWLDRGYQGEMAYLARPDGVARRAEPTRILPTVRSVVAVAANYHTVPLPPKVREDPARGVVASYAWGEDYHDLLRPRLDQLAASIESEMGQPVAHRAYVDTGPILERELAVRAGLGFAGKNTNLIHPHLGSWLFLGELLLSVELPPVVSLQPGLPGTAEATAGTCGDCTRCLDACPTGALVAPYMLDARRCISYLTIELKGPIPRDLRSLFRNRIFGCDICQEVCPWNRRFARPTTEPGFQPRPDGMAPRLLDLMDLDEEAFRRRFQGSPVKRAKRRGLLRNVAVALGNGGDLAAVPALVEVLSDAEPLIRGHAAWALGWLGTGEARDALEAALGTEREGWVREEIVQAL